MIILYMLGCVCAYFAIEGSRTGESLSKLERILTITFWFTIMPIGFMIMVLDHDKEL